MNSGVVQGFFTIADAQETCALLESLGAKFCHLQQLAAALEAAVFFAVGHNVFGDHFSDAGNIGKQGGRCGVHIHTYFIYTVFHHAGQRSAELFLIHVVLILTNADGFRVDLNQLSQRILQAATDGGGASKSHVKVRELFGTQL